MFKDRNRGGSNDFFRKHVPNRNHNRRKEISTWTGGKPLLEEFASVTSEMRIMGKGEELVVMLGLKKFECID
jgi:hypothetical protein